MAVNPRARLIPWSASPIAASSWVRWSRCDSMTVPASASQARKNAASITAPRGSSRRPPVSTAAGLSFLPSPPEGWRVYRRVPKVGERVRELADRHREALHLQAGDVVADQVPGDPGTLPSDVLVHFVVDHIQLDERRAAHTVDHDQDVAGQRQVGVDGVKRHRRDLARGSELRAMPAGLAVDADAQFDLGLAEVECGLAGSRYRARRQRDAEGPAALVDLGGDGRDVGQWRTALGQSAGDLLDEDGGADAAAARGIERVLNRDIVVHHDGGNVDVVVFGQLRCHLEVQYVACVVLDDMQHARAGADGLGRDQHLVRHGGGEDLARTRRVEHAVPDEAAVQRLVARTASGQEANFARRRAACPGDHLVLKVDRQAGMRRGNAGEGVGHYAVGRIDELLHAVVSRTGSDAESGSGDRLVSLASWRTFDMPT